MTDARWSRVVELFHATLERADPERDRFLRDACGDDDELLETMRSLVAADGSANGDALEELARGAAAALIGGSTRLVPDGDLIGRYHIVSHLGSGGMGDVYRATDPVLGRDVALKVLAPRLQGDPGFRGRLKREARAASSLNHPNIVTIYEIGRHGESDFVASELVDGETLRTVIAAGPLAIGDLVAIGAQVAAGLAAAHAAGIVHRDVKPENVIIRRDGIVKLVDFGLAKSSVGIDSAAITRASVTIRTGAIAGTACYMSPEQALGDAIDARSDLFSVGVVLYEMATGIRPFTGPSDAALYDALLHGSPAAPSTIRPELPVALDAVIGRALEKERELRYQSAGDLASDLKRLQRPLSASALALASGPPRAAGGRHWWSAAALISTAVAIGLAVTLLWRPAPPGPQPTRFTFGPPPRTAFTLTGTIVPSVTVSVSPDGRNLAFLANEPNTRGRLWIRALDSTDATPLADTDGATFPFWSPDGRNVAFFADGMLKVKPLAGGSARAITAITEARGGTWNRDGVILFGTAEGPIYRVPAAGGTATAVTTLDAAAGESWHRFPEFLPNGDRFLYLARAGETRTLTVGSIDGRLVKRLIVTDFRASYADPGYLLTVQNGALMARRFDTRRLELAGDPIEVAPSVATSTALDASFAVSPSSVLAFAPRVATNARLTWYDRSGGTIGTTGPPGDYLAVRTSPDEGSVAVARSTPDENAPEIWLLDVGRGAASRFTFNKWLDISPVWSPDGQTVAFASSRSGRFEIFRRAAQGGAPEQLMFRTDTASVYPEDWSPDGKTLVYSTDPPGRSWDLGMVDVRTSQATPLATTEYDEYHARISPDARWLAFTSDQSGQPEVYIRPFPGAGADVLVSTGGGSEPSWRRDGRELFYVAPDGMMMSVDLPASGRMIPGRPRALFNTRITGTSLRNITTYAVSADGQRFLLPSAATPDRTPSTISVIVNWVESVRR